MNNGYVSLHRKMFDNKLWFSEKFTKAQAWIDLFANANHADSSFWVRGNEVKVLRGQLGWSELTMAQRWGWSKNRVRRFLKWLEAEQQIEQQKTYITSIITIKNYCKYQETKQQTIQQKDSRRYTNNNDNNDNKNNNNSDGTSQDIISVIESFKTVNSAYKKWFANTTQRSAIKSLIQTHGLERVLQVIALLSKTNVIPYMPVINTPVQLEEKWSALESALMKKKNELQNKNNIAFV